MLVRGRRRSLWEVSEFYIELNCLDHKHISQRLEVSPKLLHAPHPVVYETMMEEGALTAIVLDHE